MQRCTALVICSLSFRPPASLARPLLYVHYRLESLLSLLCCSSASFPLSLRQARTPSMNVQDNLRSKKSNNHITVRMHIEVRISSLLFFCWGEAFLHIVFVFSSCVLLLCSFSMVAFTYSFEFSFGLWYCYVLMMFALFFWPFPLHNRMFGSLGKNDMEFPCQKRPKLIWHGWHENLDMELHVKSFVWKIKRLTWNPMSMGFDMESMSNRFIMIDMEWHGITRMTWNDME